MSNTNRVFVFAKKKFTMMIYVADIAILMSNFDYFTITKYNENLLSNNTDDAESPK